MQPFRFLRFAVLGLTVCWANRSGLAQSTTGLAAAESASVARQAWARANAALRDRRLADARRDVEHAASAWPTQPAYVWAAAILASRAADTAAVLRHLGRYAALGLGRDIASDKDLSSFAALPMFANVRRAHELNARPIATSHLRTTFGDSSFWAEGIDADPGSGRLFVASIRHRTIAELLPDGRTRELWPRDQPALGAIFGVRWDARHNVLWATTSGVPQAEGYTPADSAIAALLEIRPSDGRILHRFDLAPVAGGHVLGDLAVAPSGDVFVTDSNQPYLYRLRANGDSLESITSPLFHSLQGIAPAPDGKRVYVADYSLGLLRIDLASRAVTRLEDAPRSTSLGCDGLAWDRGSIVAVQNGATPARIVRFSLDAFGRRITRVEVLDRNSAVADEPTIGTILGDQFIYVANGQWEKHDGQGKPLPGHPLSPTVLLSLPLRR